MGGTKVTGKFPFLPPSRAPFRLHGGTCLSSDILPLCQHGVGQAGTAFRILLPRGSEYSPCVTKSEISWLLHERYRGSEAWKNLESRSQSLALRLSPYLQPPKVPLVIPRLLLSSVKVETMADNKQPLSLCSCPCGWGFQNCSS